MYAESMYWPAYRVSLCELEAVCKEHAALEAACRAAALKAEAPMLPSSVVKLHRSNGQFVHDTKPGCC